MYRKENHPGVLRLVSWGLAATFLGPPLGAQSDPITEIRAEIVALRQEYRAEIAALRQEHEGRLAALEGRLAALEDTPSRETAPADDDLAALRAAARAAAAETPAPAAAPQAVNLNRLNPEISFTANIIGATSDSARDEFQTQELELDLQAALDPYSKMRFTLAIGEEEIEFEEVYINYASLAGGLGLSVGKFRQTFGALNRQHLHALPQTEYPLPLTTYFGEEGLAQTGISLDWLVPRPWASANEITLQLTDGESDAFGGEDFEQLAVLAHIKNYWDLSSGYFEWGLSGAFGETGDGGDSEILGTDVTLSWQPPERAKYRGLTWRTEVLRSERDDAFGVSQEAWGGYSYLEGLLRRNLYLGVRYDEVEDPFEPERRFTAFVPYLTWWQSEFVRLRAEFQRLEDELSNETENRFLFQLTWAAGPHKHETY